jgi:hypothetical protein
MIAVSDELLDALGIVSYRFRGRQDLVVPTSRKPRPGCDAPGKGGTL